MKKKPNKIPRMNVPHKLYILMRNDLPSLNAGKAMAQAAHAANQFIECYGKSLATIIREDWASIHSPFFGTTIVLSVDYSTLLNTLEKAQYLGVPYGKVWDETYPFVVDKEIASVINLQLLTADSIWKKDGQVVMFRNELTCGYVFVADGSTNQQEIVGALPLHP